MPSQFTELSVGTVIAALATGVVGYFAGNVVSTGSITAATLSGTTLTVSLPGAANGQALCKKNTGVIGYCSTTPTNGACTCN